MMKYSFSKNIKIQNKIISNDSPVFIIAEAGVNHNGDINKAIKMIDVASDLGVDAVKFQTFKTEDLILRDVEKAPYQKNLTPSNENQYEMLKKLELPAEVFKELKDYCEKKNIIFLSTPFEKSSLDLLDELNICAFKISSTDITNTKFLIEVAKKNKPILLSAGMCDMPEVENAINTIHDINNELILMQCTSNYPTDDKEINLNVINTFKTRFDIIVGFSDHSAGVGASPFAVAAGARVIEKHFTLNKDDFGPDHKASLDPKELEKLVKEIRKVERYMGSENKFVSDSEKFTKKSLQKSLVAAKNIIKGEIFSEDNIVAKRVSGKGISAIEFKNILGKQAIKDFMKDDLIEL